MKITQKKIDNIRKRDITPCPTCANPMAYTTFLDRYKMLWGLTKCRMNDSHYTYMKGLGKVKV